MVKDFENITLCAERTASGTRVIVEAGVKDGKLKISGHDLGGSTDDFYGDSDYEYWYTMNEKNTALLQEKLGGERSFKEQLSKRLASVDGCKRFREFCKKEGLEYQFTNY